MDGQERSRVPMRIVSAIGAAFIVGVAFYVSRLSPTTAATGDDKNTATAVAKANAFLESLDAKQRNRASLEFDSPKKPSWSNLPVTMVPRNGLRLGELSKQQRAAALELLAAVLSKEGYQKALDIMEGDERIIKDKANKMQFGTEHFYLALFGKPSTTTPWMVQFGGHHLGINVTLVGKSSVLTPTHTGAQPDVFERNGKKIRPLGPENDLAFKLVNMLDEKQRKQAVLGEKPKNLILGPGVDNKTVAPEGLKGSAMTEAQKGTMLELIGAWVHILPQDAATSRLAELRSKLDETYFTWYGPTTNGSAAYFRIQGPSLWIEYAPQGSTSHIHTIIRDPKNDYGKQLTK